MESNVRNADTGSLTLAQQKVVTPHFDIDRIAHRREADDFKFGSHGESHFEQTLPGARRKIKTHHTAAGTRDQGV
jgi:hypothetical protein